MELYQDKHQYKILLENQYGILVKNITSFEDKMLCKYNCEVCESLLCSNGYYYLPISEEVKVINNRIEETFFKLLFPPLREK